MIDETNPTASPLRALLWRWLTSRGPFLARNWLNSLVWMTYTSTAEHKSRKMARRFQDVNSPLSSRTGSRCERAATPMSGYKWQAILGTELPQVWAKTKPSEPTQCVPTIEAGEKSKIFSKVGSRWLGLSSNRQALKQNKVDLIKLCKLPLYTNLFKWSRFMHIHFIYRCSFHVSRYHSNAGSGMATDHLTFYTRVHFTFLHYASKVCQMILSQWKKLALHHKYSIFIQ